MAAKSLPDVVYLRECLDYNPETGNFFWRWRPRSHFTSDRGHWQWNPKYAGRPAGGLSPEDGTHKITINLIVYRAHRLAWILVHGAPIPDEIDHINCNRSDNRIANLRLATRSENAANLPRRRNNTSGVKGVSFDNTKKWFVAYVGSRRLGVFRTLEEAAVARRDAAERLHGEFVRHE
jgi:hypothetical protein